MNVNILYPISTDTVSTIGTGLSNPTTIAYTQSGSPVYVLTIYQFLSMTVGGQMTVSAGLAGSLGFADGLGTAAMFHWPSGLVIHPITKVIYITVRPLQHSLTGLSVSLWIRPLDILS